jgi:hypothetical protein
MAYDGNSYRQIFRASSIIGGAQALNYLIGLARIKVVALLIGPAGVGLFDVYMSTLALVSVLTDFGACARNCASNNHGDLRARSRSICVARGRPVLESVYRIVWGSRASANASTSRSLRLWQSGTSPSRMSKRDC